VGEREDRGEISEADAMSHPRRNEVYRDVGSQEHAPDDQDFIEVQRIPFAQDGALLLCSDGLSDALSSKQILAIVEENAGDRAAAVNALVAAATQVGKDNVSAILVEGDKFAASFRKRAVVRPIAPAPTPQVHTIIQHAHVPWYKRSPLWLVLGLVLGSLGTYAALKFLVPEPLPQGPQSLYVKAPDTIAGTLEKARLGDTVFVTPGTYTESVNLKDGVDLVAQRAHDAIIDGSVSADNIRRGRLEGFQVHAVTVHDSDVSLSRLEVSGAHDAGVEFTGTSRGSLVASWIHNNAGPGVVIKDSAAPALENNIIISNGTTSKRPGLFIQSSLRPRVTGNIFLSNGAEAIWLPEADQPLIDRNYFNVSGKPDNRPKFRVGGSRESR
jgi:parallel beta-helix repeat protein